MWPWNYMNKSTPGLLSCPCTSLPLQLHMALMTSYSTSFMNKSTPGLLSCPCTSLTLQLHIALMTSYSTSFMVHKHTSFEQGLGGVLSFRPIAVWVVSQTLVGGSAKVCRCCNARHVLSAGTAVFVPVYQPEICVYFSKVFVTQPDCAFKLYLKSLKYIRYIVKESYVFIDWYSTVSHCVNH